MDRKETVEFFLACQSRGRQEYPYDKPSARSLAKNMWNSWAEGVIERKRNVIIDFSDIEFRIYDDICEEIDGAFIVNVMGFNEIDFSSYIFPGDTTFSGCLFKGAVKFDGAVFSGAVQFNNSVFNNSLSLQRVSFRGYCTFERADFMGYLIADKANFHGTARLNSSYIRGYAYFREAVFEKYASFNGVRFGGNVYLYKSLFNNAPDFVGARFIDPPHFDSVSVSTPHLWGKKKPDNELPPLYRALKRLAIAAHDRDRELEFFAGEMRASRFVTDFPTLSHGLPAMGRFWVGMAYDVFSDFGRSIVRPLAAWLAVALICSVYYLSQAKEVEYTFLGLFRWAECRGVEDPQTSAPAEALHLAFRNGLIVLYSGDESTHRTYGCLYGYQSEGARTPYVPASVSAVSAIQKMLSLLFIFLAGLGLRNMLKMK